MPSRRRRLTNALWLVVASLTWCTIGRAQPEGVHVTASPYMGGTLWSEDVLLRDRVMVGGRVGLMANRWVGIEGAYGRSSTRTDFAPNVSTTMEHIGVDLLFSPLPYGWASPYLIAGWSQLRYDSGNENTLTGSTPYVFQGFEFGGGVRLGLSENDGVDAAIRVDVRDVVTDLVQWFPNYEDNHHNVLFTVGLQLGFGRPGGDEDRDGVKDRNDLCLSTPVGAIVDDMGCPSDTDGDGVYDGLDVCAATPRGARVNRAGCPIDSDLDGIFDGIDRCPETPQGARVDAGGCPADSDGDRVFDGLDVCPDTPPSAIVDENGCPRDSDGDGVFDGIDLCPATAADLRVDQFGCPIQVTETETELFDTGMIRRQIRFATGRWEIQPVSFPVLDDVGRALLQWPDLDIEIGGHADATGDDAANMNLSYRRAQSVLEYLTARFPRLRGERFTVKGYGETLPIATNDTPEGRAQNRRVEFVIVNRDQLQRTTETPRLLKR